MISEQSKEKIALICLKKCVRHKQVRASMQAAAATKYNSKLATSLKGVKLSFQWYFHLKRYPKEIELKIYIRYELAAIDVYDSLRYHSVLGLSDFVSLNAYDWLPSSTQMWRDDMPANHRRFWNSSPFF